MADSQATPAYLKNSSFNKEGYQIYWDSTSLGMLKTCPRKYQLAIREGLAPTERSPDLTWGILIHEASEVYHFHRAKGDTHDNALNAAMEHTIKESWKEELIDGREPKKDRRTLLRAVAWYLDHYENDGLETVILANGKPATELSFRLDLPAKAPTGENYVFCGHIDRLARDEDGVYVVDIKSTKSSLGKHFFDKFNPDNQMSLYSMAARVLYSDDAQGVIIDGVQCAIGFNRFTRAKTHRHEEQLDEWIEDAIWWIQQAEGLVSRRGDSPWPQNDKSCHIYRPCEFTGICTERNIHRKGLKEMNYEKRIWDPAKSREV